MLNRIMSSVHIIHRHILEYLPYTQNITPQNIVIPLSQVYFLPTICNSNSDLIVYRRDVWCVGWIPSRQFENENANTLLFIIKKLRS